MHRKLLLVITVFTISFSSFSQSGKLEKGKESLKSTTSTSSSSSTSSSNSSKKSKRASKRNDNGSFFGSFFGEVFVKLFAYTAYGVAIEFPLERETRMHSAEIAHYPYEKALQGNFIYTDSINYNVTRFDITNNFVIQNSNLYGNNFDVDFRFLKRFSVAASYLYLTEKTAIKRDDFSLYSAFLKYHRIRTQKFDAWFGLGIMHVGNDVDTSGFGLGVGAEWFIKKPVSLKFSHKRASINDREVNNTKLLFKYHLKNYHISSGYEQFKIGVSKIDAFSIGVGASF